VGISNFSTLLHESGKQNSPQIAEQRLGVGGDWDASATAAPGEQLSEPMTIREALAMN